MICVVCDKELGPIHYDIEPLNPGYPDDRCCLNCRIFIYELIINQSVKEKNND